MVRIKILYLRSLVYEDVSTVHPQSLGRPLALQVNGVHGGSASHGPTEAYL